MSLLKSIHRLKQVDYLIKRKATGTSFEFASRMGISRSTLMENLRVMKELGADIYFCPHSRSYLYAKDFNFFIGTYSEKRQGEKEMEQEDILSLKHPVL